MIQNIDIPDEVPFMVLNNAVLFPQSIMPLFIFEPRYKKMLNDILPSDRMFAIATGDKSKKQAANEEKFYSVAGVGIIRACKQNPDGNLNLILQGISRVKFESVSNEKPYRTACVRRIVSTSGGTNEQIAYLKQQLVQLMQTQCRLGANISKEILGFLNSIEDPEQMLDLAIYTLCSSTAVKLELLETSEVVPRFEKFILFLQAEIQQLKLNLKLKGKLDDNDIGNN